MSQQRAVSQSTDVAIVGCSVRVPGAATIAEFWSLLAEGREAPGIGPSVKLLAGTPLVDPFARPTEVDTEFFDISALEAASMDPQQALALELAWEALEHARLVPARLRGSATGVFIGASGSEFGGLNDMGPADPANAFSLTGSLGGVIANRVSDFLDLRGPSFTVDSCQSSSLTAVHLAVRSVVSGECDLAIASGIRLLRSGAPADMGRAMGTMSGLGSCRSFDADADGYVEGEGGGLVVLKRLDDAVRDGDTVYGVVVASAAHNDGGTSGALPSPSRTAQMDLLAAAYRNVDRSSVGYVEAHGSATTAGDAAEAGALVDWFGGDRGRRGPLLVGSVKSNIGHLACAGGVVGLVKVLLCLAHGVWVPSINFRRPNDVLAVSPDVMVCVDSVAVDVSAPVVAGVTSLGIGGSNCHVVLAGPPSTVTANEGVLERPLDHDVPIVVSAASARGLENQVGRLVKYLGSAAADVVDIAHSLVTTRSVLPWNAVVRGRDRAAVTAALTGYRVSARTVARPGDATVSALRFHGRSADGLRPALDRIAMWCPTAREFLAAVAEKDAEPEEISLFCFHVCVSLLAEQVGIRPVTVRGSGTGLISAAFVTGAIALPEAVRLLRSADGREELAERFLAESATKSTVEAEVMPPRGAHTDVALPLSAVRDDPDALLDWLGCCYSRGVAVDWLPLVPGGRRVSLPTYGFARTAYHAHVDPPAAADRNEAPPVSPAAGAETVLSSLMSAVESVVRHPHPAALRPDATFRDNGLTSLGAMTVYERLEASFEVELSPSVFFDYPTPLLLAEHIAQLTGADVGAVSTTAVPVAAGVAADEPIAVVAMGCRFPGGVASPEDLWRVVADGVDAIAPFPVDRGWDDDGAYPRAGGFVYDAGAFDAAFFGMSPREAMATDPQQRLLLEVAWEVFERAGIDPASLRGSATGVFTGGTNQDYGDRMHVAAPEYGGYVLTGTTPSVLSGRVSYVFGLEGPAVTVDTACSSSLVALHLAAQAVRSGECSLALAGGVTVMASPGVFAEFSRQGGLAADGRCKPFSSAADGTGWSEGVGLVLVERLSDAQRLGHPVLAVLRGSAVNQDGASNGLTAPNGPSQQRVIRQALANARIEPSTVDVVEAHGTGTTLGDPIEAQALLATYGQDRPADRPVWLGSIKSNIGHTQAAAGVAGVIKMVMALRHGHLPRTLHVDEPTPHVDWTAGAASLLTEAQPWPRRDRPRRAGVSSFGVSGTNAHVIIEEASPTESVAAPVGSGLVLPGHMVPWVVSARGERGLRAQATRLGEFVAATDADPVDVAWSLVSTRSALPDRAVVLGADRDELLSALGAVARGESPAGVIRGSVLSGRTVLAFPGQGAQWSGMAGELYAASPVFARSFDTVCGLFDPYLEYPLREVVFGGEAVPEVLGQTVFTQAGLFAVEVALYELITALGVAPDVLMGHSIGEIVAAHVAGVLSVEDAVALVAARGSLMQALPAGGAMVAVEASEDEVAATLAELADETIGIAAVNGPSAVVVSGAADAVSRVADWWHERGRRIRRLSVSHAFHSPLMEPMLADFGKVAEQLTYRAPTIPIVSNLTGQIATPDQLCSPDYWVDHVRQPVRFAESLATLADHKITRLVEVGPGATLSALARSAEGRVCVPVLRKDRPEVDELLRALGDMHVHGVPVDWTAVFTGSGGTQVELPTYAFQPERYWLDNASDSSGDADDAAFWELVERGDVEEFTQALNVDGGPDWDAVLPVLSAWRRRQRHQADIDQWLYRVRWQPIALSGIATLSGNWLIVGDADDVADALRGHGAQVSQLDGMEWDREELAERIRSLISPGDDSYVGVIAVPTSVADLLVLVRALVAEEVRAPLWCATRGAVAVGLGDPVDPAQAPLWGLGRTIGLELPDLWGGLVDLPAGLDARNAADLCRLLGGPGGEDQVALRASGAFARRLTGTSGVHGASSGFGDGAVLITGGTGALGVLVARYIVAEHRVRRVVLVSRRGLAADGVQELTADLTGVGTDVEVHACNVADRDAVTALLEKVTARGPVSAVIHAAGVVENAAVLDLCPDAVRRIFGPKVDGAWHLHELTKGMGLSAFVLFSSISAVWGSANQAAYAAANAYLDALAEHRLALGLPAVSVAWGPWDGAGMAAAAGPDAVRRLRRLGVAALSPEHAVTALRAALGQQHAGIVVADVDWKAFLPVFLASRASMLFDELPGVAAILDSPDDATTPLAARLGELSDVARRATVFDVVRGEVAAVLGHRTTDRIDVDRTFRDLGFDSMTAMELRNRLSTATGLPLPPTLVFNYPTPARLADHIQGAIVRITDGDDMLAAIRRLSDEYTARGAGPDFTRLLDDLNRRVATASAPTSAAKTTVADLSALTDLELLENLTKELDY